MSLAGRVALVTGASRGIGAATASELAAQGVAVVLAARSLESLHTLVTQIEANGGRAAAVACDVSVYDDVESAVSFALERFGPVDILINNAGVIEPIDRLADSDPAHWGHAIDVNVKGVYHGIRAVSGCMSERGTGVIVNLSSGAATGALEAWSHYCASKAAVLALTRCAHKELARLGVRVVGLSPGMVATDMQTSIRASGINPVSQSDPDEHIPPEWVARAIAWLCTDAAREHDGGDFSIKTEAGRQAVGLPPLGKG